MIPLPVARDDDPFAWSRVLVRGSQSTAFLQGQLSQDVDGVGDEMRTSAILSPSGEVVATCWLRGHDDGYELLIASGVVEVAVARLKRFLLRVDCTLDVEGDAPGPFNTVGEQVRRREPGPLEFVGLVPQAYGASFVARNVSFDKGCFTGQELVGRLDARAAQVPWRFVHASGPSLDEVEAALVHKGPAGPKGVCSAVRTDDGVHALGFVHRSAIDTWGDSRVDVHVVT